MTRVEILLYVHVFMSDLIQRLGFMSRLLPELTQLVELIGGNLPLFLTTPFIYCTQKAAPH